MRRRSRRALAPPSPAQVPSKEGSKVEIEVLVKREGDESYSMVSWCLSLHDANWLIDSMNIV